MTALPTPTSVRSESPPASAQHLAGIAPKRWEIAALGILLTIALLLWAFTGYEALNLIVPLGLIGILGVANLQLARTYPVSIWTPLFGFRLSATVFFGIGALLPFFFNAFTMEYTLSLYSYTPEEAAKANLIWCVATFAVIAGAYLTAKLVPVSRFVAERSGPDGTLAYGIGFFAIGFGFSVFVELPQQLGIFTAVIPGSVVLALQAMNSVGLFLIALWGFTRGTRGYAIVALLIFANFLLAIIALIKSLILLPLLLVATAYLINRPSLPRVLGVTLAMLFALSVLQPLIDHGRASRTASYGEVNGGTIGERIGYAVSWIQGDRDDDDGESVNPLARLSYLNAATYVISRFDSHQPANSVESAFSALIPRIFWPDKPYTTAISGDLYYELTGSEGSSLGTTVPADVYWNFGWFGLIAIFPILGGLAMLTSFRCYTAVFQRDWLLLPFVLVCFRIALSMDNQFVNSVFVPIVMAGVLYIFLRSAAAIIPGHRDLASGTVAMRPGSALPNRSSSSDS